MATYSDSIYWDLMLRGAIRVFVPFVESNHVCPTFLCHHLLWFETSDKLAHMHSWQSGATLMDLWATLRSIYSNGTKEIASSIDLSEINLR
jgi:hypothetical protein